MTKNGMAIFEVTDTNQKAVFIDEDTLEAVRLSAMCNRNKKRGEAERKKIQREQRIIEKKQRKWREYTIDTFSYIGIRLTIAGCSLWAMIAGLINPVIAIPVSIYCIAVACIRFGVWYANKN